MDDARLAELLARIESANGPDRELDADIALALLDARTADNYYAWQGSRPKGSPPKPDRDFWLSRRLGLTTSIDAALALVERVLPGACLVLNTHQRSAMLARTPIHMEAVTAKATTVPLAILAALIKALRAKITQGSESRG